MAERLGVPLFKIRNAIIWGNHSATQFPDLAHAYVDSMYGAGLHESVRTAINNDGYIKEEFVKTVQKRVSLFYFRVLQLSQLVSYPVRRVLLTLLVITSMIGLWERDQ